MRFNHVEVSTEVFSPFFWKVIVENATSYQVGGLRLFHLNTPIDFTEYTKADRKLLQKLGKQVSLFNTYAWFTDYTIMREETSENETLITFGDLRFASAVPFIQNLRENGELPFALTAVLDENQKLVRYYYHRPGRTKMIEHLE